MGKGREGTLARVGVRVVWIPIAIVALMAGASLEAYLHGNWRYGTFWLMDAALTGWSSYMLVGPK